MFDEDQERSFPSTSGMLNRVSSGLVEMERSELDVKVNGIVEQVGPSSFVNSLSLKNVTDTIQIWSRTAGNELDSKLIDLLILERRPNEQVREAGGTRSSTVASQLTTSTWNSNSNVPRPPSSMTFTWCQSMERLLLWLH